MEHEHIRPKIVAILKELGFEDTFIESLPPKYDPRKRLKNHRYEKILQRLRKGETGVDAYIATGDGKCNRASASTQVSKLKKEPYFAARLTFLNYEADLEREEKERLKRFIETKDDEDDEDIALPDLDSRTGRVQAYKDIVNRVYRGKAKDSEALAALRELGKYYGDMKQTDASDAPDPSSIAAWLTRMRIERKDAAEELVKEYGLQSVLCGVLEVFDITPKQAVRHLQHVVAQEAKPTADLKTS